MNYTFSYYAPERATHLVRRPWWAFWRHDTLVQETTLARRMICGIQEDEGKFLQRHLQGAWGSAEARVVRHLIGRDASMIQLEYGAADGAYTWVNKNPDIEPARMNLVANSDPMAATRRDAAGS